MENQLYVGFSRVDITPTMPMPLAGYGNTAKRMHTRMLDGITYTAVAFKNGVDGEIFVISTIDLSTFSRDAYKALAASLYTVGVNPDNFMISATHTHSAPDILNLKATPHLKEYNRTVLNKILKAVNAAIEELRPVTEICSGTTHTKGMNFVRHYLLEDGTYCGDNFGHPELSSYVKNASEADDSMHIVRIKRQGAKDICVVNWRAHAHKTGGSKKYDCSADFPHPFRKYLEQELGCHAAFFQGASGNLNHQTRIKEQQNTKDYMLYGKQLAQYVIDVYDSLPKRDISAVHGITSEITVKCNIPNVTPHENARKVQKVWFETNNVKETTAFAEQFGFHSPYHANAVIGRTSLPPTDTEKLYGFALGDVAFLCAPNELFDSYCKELTESSPFDTTMIFCLANGYQGYLPSHFAFGHGCYEADCTRYAEGTGEQVAEEFGNMLKELKKQ